MKYVQPISQKLIQIVKKKIYINDSKHPNKEKEGWHCLAVKKLSTLLRGITSKHNGDFYCLDYLHSFRTENKLTCHEKVYKNKGFCGIVMPLEKDNIL